MSVDFDTARLTNLVIPVPCAAGIQPCSGSCRASCGWLDPGAQAPGMTTCHDLASPSPFPATSTCRPAATPTTAACWRCCRSSASTVRHLALPGSFPAPSAADLAETRAAARRGAGRTVTPDRRPGLWRDAGRGRSRRCTARSSLWCTIRCAWRPASPSRARTNCYALEKAALALARHVVVTSPTTARTLTADFAVPGRTITVAEPGTDPADRAPGHRRSRCSCWPSARSCRARPTTCWCARWRCVQNRDWRLTIVGPTDRSAAGPRGAAGGHRRHRAWAAHHAHRRRSARSSSTDSMPLPISS